MCGIANSIFKKKLSSDRRQQNFLLIFTFHRKSDILLVYDKNNQRQEVLHLFAKVSSLGLFGLNAFPVDVEIDISRGNPQFDIV